MTLHDIPIARIIVDPDIQPRVGLVEELVSEYAERIMAGDMFPPVTVFDDGSRIWLAAGYHRLDAHKRSGRLKLLCEVRAGSKRDAALYAAGSNATHGLPRSTEDKRRAVMRLLTDPEWSSWSNREVARICRVSDHLVADLKASLTAHARSDEQNSEVTYRTKHGTVATMKTGAIGKPKSVPISALTDAEQEKYQEAFGLELLDAIMSFPPAQQREKMLLGYDAEGRVSPYCAPDLDETSDDDAEGPLAEVGPVDGGARMDQATKQSPGTLSLGCPNADCPMRR